MKNDIQGWFDQVDAMRLAGAVWPEDELPVEIKQTHISVILLGKDKVLKLKKPVDFGFLDYTTLEKRRIACEQEVRLNRRLCPEIYLGVQPIRKDESGNLQLSGPGDVFDFGVLMKRLPEDRMLDRLVTENTITEAMLESVAVRLSTFHHTARRGSDVDAYGSFGTVRYNWKENFEQTRPYIGQTISETDFEQIQAFVNQWLEENKELLNQRIKQGRICDGHGDIRCESICITDGICIFDCIEFNERFRCSDVASEAAFLAMDLDAYGRPDLGYFFYESYARKTADTQLFRLFRFYRCYRAFVRGKVLSFQLTEAELSDEDHRKAALKAENYFRIANSAARPLTTPKVIMVSGLSGTGKTSVARAIAGEFGLRVVSSDAVRKSLFGEREGSFDYGEGIYNKEASRRTYQEMLDKGLDFLQKDGGVILDATFLKAANREKVLREAESKGALCSLIECRLDPETVRRRLGRRTEKKDGLSDADWHIYQRQINEYEPISIQDDAHLVLNTDKSLTENSRLASDWLRSI